MVSRTDRDLARGRRAAASICAGGGSALEAAYAHIETVFAPAMRHSLLKDRVARVLVGGPGPGAAHVLRYRRLAERYPAAELATAIVLIERMRAAEFEARATAIRAWGHSSRPRAVLVMLDELRLILRFVRRHARSRYPAIVASVLNGVVGAGVAEAAE